MKLKHRQPCVECPWRKASAAGWLGGYSPEWYADALSHGEIPACHLNDHGPESDKTAFCAGAAATMANACQQPYKQKGAREAVDGVGKREDCFSHQALFYQHHAGEAYVHPIMRQTKEG